MTYHSFLICDHPKEGFINVYIDGLILGQINAADKKFTPDPLLERRNPFGSLEALRDHVCSIMHQVAPLAVTGTVEATPGGTAVGIPVPSLTCVMCGRPVQDKQGTLICEECAPRLAQAIGASSTPEAVYATTGTIAHGVPLVTGMAINLNGSVVEVKANSKGEVLLTYEDIVWMAANQTRIEPLKRDEYVPHLSVVYHHRVPFEQLPGERDGSMHKGCKPVKATPGMVINAVDTGNA